MKAARTLLAGSLIGLLLFSVLPASSSVAGGDNRCYRWKRTEKKFARKMNAARSSRDIGKLSLDPELSKAAKAHTYEMLKKETLYHTPSDLLTRRVTRWSLLGENVGVGGGVDSLHKAFMDSPAHKENILLNAFKHVGVGVVKEDGRMWVTVIFENLEDPGTTLDMPDC